jgi:hypothetical protein
VEADHMKRIAVFMAGVIVPHSDETAVVAMLAIAVDRLAKVDQRPAQPRDDASGGES